MFSLVGTAPVISPAARANPADGAELLARHRYGCSNGNRVIDDLTTCFYWSASRPCFPGSEATLPLKTGRVETILLERTEAVKKWVYGAPGVFLKIFDDGSTEKEGQGWQQTQNV